MELVEVGNIITVDLYLGVIKKEEEKSIEATTATPKIMINIFLHLMINVMKFAELKSLLSWILLMILVTYFFYISDKNIKINLFTSNYLKSFILNDFKHIAKVDYP